MRIKWLLFVLVLVVSVGRGEATFTCGVWTPRVGMHSFDVKAACGNPDSRVMERIPIRAKGADGLTYVRGYGQVERWTYDRRPGRPKAVLTFELAILKRIDIKTSR